MWNVLSKLLIKYRSKNKLDPSVFNNHLLQVKQLLQLSHRLLRAGHAVAHGARVLEDLVVVAALVSLVAEEVDSAVLDAADLLLGFDMLQAVSLVPPGGEDVKRDLSTDRVAIVGKIVSKSVPSFLPGCMPRNIRKTQVRELLLDSLHEFLANLVLQIKLLVLIALLHRGVPANRAYVDHAVPELDESTPLHRNVQVRDVVQDEAHELLVVVLADPLDERMRRERHAHADGGQAVLGKAEVEEVGDGDARGAQLLLLLGEVGAADEANGDLVTEGGEELEHLGGDRLEG